MGALHWDYDGEYSGGSGGFLDTLFGFIFFIAISIFVIVVIVKWTNWFIHKLNGDLHPEATEIDSYVWSFIGVALAALILVTDIAVIERLIFGTKFIFQNFLKTWGVVGILLLVIRWF